MKLFFVTLATVFGALLSESNALEFKKIELSSKPGNNWAHVKDKVLNHFDMVAPMNEAVADVLATLDSKKTYVCEAKYVSNLVHISDRLPLFDLTGCVEK